MPSCTRAHSRRTLLALAAFAAVLPVFAAPSSARAEEAGTFLKGETVRFFVGFSAGGGYDAYARMLAPHFEKRTGATVVVENRPGGKGLTALNQLVRLKPDGLTMMVLNGESAIMSQLTQEPGVAYDMNKVTSLARIAEEQHLMLVRPGMPDSLKAIAAAGKKVKFSATGRPDNLADYAAVLCEALQMSCQIITGYKGSKEAGLALMNGEVDALTISDSSGVVYAKGGRAKIIAAIGQTRSELKPDTPTVFEMFDLPPERKWWLDFRLQIKAYGRVVVAPPDLPAARAQALQKVWHDILTDPQIKAEGAKLNRPLDYASPAELDKTVKDLLHALPADRKKQVNDVILRKFSS